ncbi:uncharacterized protein LOC113360492 [Papaver somniferum]|uniref:uncharacterized protein LOC113360492 n=1 Tax=Papaver somniferum TaxID=3469 RepID=UPI000E6F91D6|nr:uncharacterized protein LOC113360492 [Papaver somniferum]
MSSRIKFILKGLISSSQSTFISGRYVRYNILLAHKIVRNYHKSGGSPRCALKIDLQKAYDTFSWEAIAVVVRKFGSLERGVGQGCPMYPYLIVMVMVMEVLSVLLQQQVLYVNYGLHPKCKGTTLTHLCFADDTLVFFKGSDLGRKHNPISWIQICTTERDGGLGVRDLEQTNISANLRYIWDINSGKDTIWTKWIHTNLIKQGDFWSLVVPKDYSRTWRRILEFRDIAKQFTGTCLGNGKNTSLYYGFWHPNGRLCDQMVGECLDTICPNKELKVDHYMVNGIPDFTECNHWPHCDGRNIL